ncbi:hypothetical protein HYX18_02595 [Candidatus Woesearchaeota archaeon]|nr:hypothetical protein [Candidatus Woesearchaeota archaeon]
MQITFNTEDSLDDLSKIHEILADAIRKKGGVIKLEQPQAQQPQTQQQTVTIPLSQVPGFGSFSNTLKQDMALSMGLGTPQRPVVQQPQQPKSEIQIINERYRREYEENKRNQNKPKDQNPEIDMSNIYYSNKRKRF